jgi:hypothetical protein
MAQNILVVGGSRHIGYYSALRFLDAGATVTFLLRSPTIFDNDNAIQNHVRSGKAHLFKGDALVREDIQKLWAEASKETPVDLVLFTVGFSGTPKFHLMKGFVMTPSNLVTQCLLNVLGEMPKNPEAPFPKVITLSATGVSLSSRAKVPLALRVFYGYLIQHPLQDKLGMERVIYHCAGWDWDATDGEPSEEIMGSAWREREGLPAPGTLTNAIVLRPALLNDGECLADAGKSGAPYRAGEGQVVGWSVSRKDVAHFIFDVVTNHWEKYGNKQISIAY